MSRSACITYYYHSGFSAAVGDQLLVFDYWRGEHGELPEERQITEAYLRSFRNVWVFISHAHPDHMDSVVFDWRLVEGVQVVYVVSDDMPIGTRGRRLAAGEKLVLSDRVTVWAYDSTDLGVSYLVEADGLRIFHAGDLNFWHWREESTVREIDEAEKAFHAAVAPIRGQKIDVAFFPIDPRQGLMYDAGGNYFIMVVKPRLLIPMHFWGRSDIVSDFARRAGTADTEIIPLTVPGEKMTVTFDDDESVDVRIVTPAMVLPAEELVPADPDDPFADTDLPVSLDDDPVLPADAPAEEPPAPQA